MTALPIQTVFQKQQLFLMRAKCKTGKSKYNTGFLKANENYKTVMKPLEYTKTENILSAAISGNFPGSPLVLKYDFEIVNDKIQSLKIMG